MKNYAIIKWQKGRHWGPYAIEYQDSETPTYALRTFETFDKAILEAQKLQEKDKEYIYEVISLAVLTHG